MLKFKWFYTMFNMRFELCVKTMFELWRLFCNMFSQMLENITRTPSFLQLKSGRQGLIANAMAHKAQNMASHVTTNVHLSLQ